MLPGKEDFMEIFLLAFITIFLGAISAQALNHGLAAWLGRSLYSKVPPVRIKQAASLLFLLVGIIIILLEI